MHSFGAWQGMMITGSRASRILEARNRVYFDLTYARRRNFSRLMISAPEWRVDQHEAVLTGAAERLSYDLHASERAAVA
jgi:glucokinase